MRKEARTCCFEGGIADLGWDPAACLAWPLPMAESRQPWRSCFHLSLPIMRRNSPPFSSPADVLWLRLRKITTPHLETVDTSSSGTKSREGICHALIKAIFPCTQSHVKCWTRNCPVSLNTCRLHCLCAQGAMVTSATPIHLYKI